MSFFKITGFGLIVKTSNPKLFKFSIFFFPISVMFGGSQFTNKHLSPNSSRAIIACLVLSFPPLHQYNNRNY